MAFRISRGLCNLGRPRHFEAGRYVSSSPHSSSERSVGYLLLSIQQSVASGRHLFQTVSPLDFSHWVAMQTASLQVPRMPLRLFAGRCRYPTRKKSPKPSRAEIASSGAHEEEDGTRRPNRTAIGPRQAALGVTD